MAHKLIVGQTLSGKSTLAKAFAADAVKRGIVPVVYDPTLSEWPTEFVTDDFAEFVEFIHTLHADGFRMVAIVDEADTVMSMADRGNWWLFTRGRHYGLEAIAITQRPKLVAPTVRGNCADAFIFHLGKNDASELADDISADGASAAPTLRQGEFFHVGWENGERFCRKQKIF